MNNIVVYRIIIVISAMVLASGLKAQKPSIDLITSHQQHRQSETMIDTGHIEYPPEPEPNMIQLSHEGEQKIKDRPEKKKHRQIGPSLDSIFPHREAIQNAKTKDSMKKKAPIKVTLWNRKYNPVKFLIYIIALN
jgi:hypothetical protein